jgi:hypothetical protein
MSETTDVASENPREVQRLQAEADKARAELGDALLHRLGRGNRSPGLLNLQKASP